LNVINPAELEQGTTGIGGDPVPLGAGVSGQRQLEHNTVVLDPNLLDPLQIQKAAAGAGIFQGLEGGEGLFQGLVCAGHRAITRCSGS
jgi:hypothetical protein